MRKLFIALLVPVGVVVTFGRRLILWLLTTREQYIGE